MKIPETSANVGAYYGNEENGQWQPNGVIIDNGVGGGVVGSGDAGMHRGPVYPVHITRGHVPAGYVMAGPYYGAPYGPVPPPQPDDFADYMWMENEEEFDKQVLQQLEEEALMEQCIEAMLEDEQRERRANREHRRDYPTTSNGNTSVSLEEAVSRSTLNPLAAEFVPTRGRPAPTTVPEEKQETPPPPQTEAPSPSEEPSRTEESVKEEKNDSRTDATEETKAEEAVTPPKDPPEVSAADIHPTKQIRRDKETKRPTDKRPVKVEPKKKPIVVKSETKVQPKKKEVKTVKSEVKMEEKVEVKVVKSEVKAEEKIEDVVTEVAKPQSPTEEVQTPPGPKPINYAAAARASKPKLKPTTPPVDKPAPTTTIKKETPKPETKEKPKSEKVEKKIAPKDKTVAKDKVNVQRKNSAK